MSRLHENPLPSAFKHETDVAVTILPRSGAGVAPELKNAERSVVAALGDGRRMTTAALEYPGHIVIAALADSRPVAAAPLIDPRLVACASEEGIPVKTIPNDISVLASRRDSEANAAASRCRGPHLDGGDANQQCHYTGHRAFADHGLSP